MLSLFERHNCIFNKVFSSITPKWNMFDLGLSFTGKLQHTIYTSLDYVLFNILLGNSGFQILWLNSAVDVTVVVLPSPLCPEEIERNRHQCTY